MRRIGFGIIFFLFGLLTTWASCWAGSHMTFRLQVGRRLSFGTGCYEIDHCVVPWWVMAGMLAYLLGPSAVFAVIGWRVGTSNTPLVKMAILLPILTVLGAAFFLLSYALGP